MYDHTSHLVSRPSRWLICFEETVDVTPTLISHQGFIEISLESRGEVELPLLPKEVKKNLQRKVGNQLQHILLWILLLRHQYFIVVPKPPRRFLFVLLQRNLEDIHYIFINFCRQHIPYLYSFFTVIRVGTHNLDNIALIAPPFA